MSYVIIPVMRKFSHPDSQQYPGVDIFKYCRKAGIFNSSGLGTIGWIDDRSSAPERHRKKSNPVEILPEQLFGFPIQCIGKIDWIDPNIAETNNP
jgi:hypothetical protein